MMDDDPARGRTKEKLPKREGRETLVRFKIAHFNFSRYKMSFEISVFPPPCSIIVSDANYCHTGRYGMVLWVRTTEL